MIKHAMEPVKPEFYKSFAKGDIIVGGRNFGCGSSREQAPQVLKELGIKCIIAEGFARIFYRNCINIGLPVIEIKGISKKVRYGEILEIDFEKGIMSIGSIGESLEFKALPTFLMRIINFGGLIESVNNGM